MIKKGLYRHFKGKEYEVLGACTHSETLEEMVIYKKCYDNFDVWVRPASMWDELVEYNGSTVARFTFIS